MVHHHSLGLLVTLDLGGSVDVGDIGSDTWGTSNIVKSQRGDQWVSLQQQGHGLSDSSGSSKNSDGSLRSERRGESSLGDGRGGLDGFGEHC